MLELRGSRVRVSDTLRMTPDGSSDTLLSAAQLTNLLAQNQVSLIGDNSRRSRTPSRGSTTMP